MFLLYIFSDTPMGYLPYLEVEGKIICQSNAINRFLAGELGGCSNKIICQSNVINRFIACERGGCCNTNS